MTAGRGGIAWRLAFLVGLVAGVAFYLVADGPLRAIELKSSLPVLIAGGFLVGFGTKLGGGCTSGHGICGLSQLLPRSAVATVSLMIAAASTFYVIRHLIGG